MTSIIHHTEEQKLKKKIKDTVLYIFIYIYNFKGKHQQI